MKKSLKDLTPADMVEYLKTIDPKTWIRIGILSVLLAVLGVFIVWPAWVQRAEVKKKQAAIKGQVVILDSLIRQEAVLNKKKEDLLRFIYGAKERLFQKDEVSLLLGQIAKLADDSETTIVNSSPRPFEGEFPAPFDSQYESSRYDLSVEGGFHDLGRFVAALESNPKLLRVQLFHVLGDEESLGAHVVDMTLTAVSFKKSGEAT